MKISQRSDDVGRNTHCKSGPEGADITNSENRWDFGDLNFNNPSEIHKIVGGNARTDVNYAFGQYAVRRQSSINHTLLSSVECQGFRVHKTIAYLEKFDRNCKVAFRYLSKVRYWGMRMKDPSVKKLK